VPKTSVESAKQAWSGAAESSNCNAVRVTFRPPNRFIEEGLMASKPATTVTLKHLAASLAEDNELSKKQAEAILGGLVGNIVKHLKKGERIRIGGLGILQVRKRAARMGRNPATGQPIQIKASKKVAFRASKELKEAI
jgi:DNA-binding protein HU-beta